MRISLIAGAALFVAVANLVQAQDVREQFEVLRGTVRSSDGHAIAGATVIATRAPDRLFKSTTSDSAGQYEIVWPNGTGDYLMHFSAPSFESFRRRVTRSADSVLVVDGVLSPTQTPTLNTVRITASRPKPVRDEGTALGAGAAEHFSDGIKGAVAFADEGNLNALATLIPGASQVGNGFSLLGLDANRNAMTFNGLSFAGTEIPRDLTADVRVSTSTYDPSRGWFSGAQVNVQLAPGWLIENTEAHATVDASERRIHGSAANGSSLPLGRYDVGVGRRGPLTDDDQWFYNGAIQADRRILASTSLLSATPVGLERLGLSSDSVARLAVILDNLGLSGRSAFSNSAIADRASFALRLDRSPYVRGSGEPARSTLNLTLIGNGRRITNNDAAPTSIPTAGSTQTFGAGTAQLGYSRYFSSDYLFDARTSVSATRTSMSRETDVPLAVIAIQSAPGTDADQVQQTVSVGGNENASDATSIVWESTADWQMYLPSHFAHRLKFSLDSRIDMNRATDNRNTLGTFSFDSLAAFEHNVATSFSRTLSALQTRSRTWNVFVAASDNWTPTRTFQMMYGLRADGSTFLAAKTPDPDVARKFGERVDYTPSQFHVSPRVGFTWIRRRADASALTNALGRFNFGPNSSLRGGIGEFRDMMSPDLVAVPTLRPGIVQDLQLTCLGVTTPTPAWTQYPTDRNTIPSNCNGQDGSYPARAQSLSLIGRDYAPPSSWRANLAYSTSARGVNLSIEGILSQNVHQPSSTDLNFAGAPAFLTSDEHRPVFVRSVDILQSGVVPMQASRKDPAYTHVYRSDAKGSSTSTLLTITMMPTISARHWTLLGAYSVLGTRQHANGFMSTTFASPLSVERGATEFLPRHQFRLQAGYFNTHGFYATLYTTIRSGLSYTPVIASDINGDGLANDRAVIFDPATTADSVLRTGMLSLLREGDRQVRKCLGTQLGQVAERASCTTPWAVFSSMQLGFSGRSIHLGSRTNISLGVQNLLPAIDALLHGADHPHGWGRNALPDRDLYIVRGFDATQQRFSYEVNSRFGNTKSATNALMVPYAVSLDVKIDLSRPYSVQQLDRALKPGRAGRAGPRLTVAQLKRGYARSVSNPFRSLLLLSDSLLLNRVQIDSLGVLERALDVQLDSIFTQLANDLGQLPDSYSANTALRRQESLLDAAAELTHRSALATWPQLLLPIQRRLLPGALSAYLDPSLPAQRFRGASPF